MIDFSHDEGLPERSDFFFNIGEDGYAVLASSYDLETSQRLLGPLVASIEPR